MQRLLELNKRGLIHAPDEPEQIFFQRCQAASPLSSKPIFSLNVAEELFDISPDWVEVIYDNKGLRLWEGGCTWIGEKQATLQLNKAFLKKASHFGYKREEIAAHELVHIVRGTFEEPIFEEILAYQTSSSLFRRFFGPIFRSPNESLIFVGTIGGFCVASVFEMFQIPILMILTAQVTWGLFRLIKAQTIFNRARKKLSKLLLPDKVLAVMLRLTDREIVRFSKMSEEEIVEYAQKMAKTTLRWKQICSAYL